MALNCYRHCRVYIFGIFRTGFDGAGSAGAFIQSIRANGRRIRSCARDRGGRTRCCQQASFFGDNLRDQFALYIRDPCARFHVRLWEIAGVAADRPTANAVFAYAPERLGTPHPVIELISRSRRSTDLDDERINHGKIG